MGSLNKEKYIERYGEQEGTRKYDEFRKSRVQSESRMIRLYGEEEGKRRWEESKKKKKYALTLNAYIDRYGEEEGNKKWIEFGKRSTHTLENMIERYGEEDGRKRYEERNKKVGKSNSVDFYIERYGEEEGRKKWEIYLKKISCNLENMIKKYGEEEGKKRYEERNKKIAYGCTLDFYIKKYGEEEGEKILKNIRKQITYKSSLKHYIEKYGEFDGKLKWIELIRKKISGCNKGFYKHPSYSKISQILFFEIIKRIPDGLEAKFAENGGEIFIETKKPDFVFKDKIIEFYGDLFHANPALFEEWMEPNPFISKKQKISGNQISRE